MIKKYCFGIGQAACLMVASISTVAASELPDHTLVQEFQKQVRQVEIENDREYQHHLQREYSASDWLQYSKDAAASTVPLMLDGLKQGLLLKGLPEIRTGALLQSRIDRFDKWLRPLIRELAQYIWIPKYCAEFGVNVEDFKQNQDELMSRYTYTDIENIQRGEVITEGAIKKKFGEYEDNQLKVRQAIVDEIFQIRKLFQYVEYNATGDGVYLDDLEHSFERAVDVFLSDKK